MLLLVGPPERSTARKLCPASPPGFIAPPKTRLPPRLTAVLWSKVGVWPPIWALLERSQKNPLNPSPPINRLPLVSTSSVPSVGELRITIGVCQVTPPSVERWNCTPLPLQLIPSLDWYWKPCPGPLVLSMANHSLSPPPASPSAWSSVQD